MKYTYKTLLVLLVASLITSCSLDPIKNPNGPTQESYLKGASKKQLNELVTGTESSLRNDMGIYYRTISILGREYYDLNGTDPRYTGEILGAGEGKGVLDDNGFLTTRPFGAKYRSARTAQVLIEATNNAAASVTDIEKNGYRAFATFAKAYNMLLILNRQYENGVRSDISNPDKLGPYTNYEQGLNLVNDLIKEAIEFTKGSGDAFSFSLSAGFGAFNTPATFEKLLYGLKARVDIYKGDKAAANASLDASFLNPSADLGLGVYHVFSSADLLNPLFFAPDQNKHMAHPSYLTDIESGDDRANKVRQYKEAVTLDDLTSDRQVAVFKTNTDPFPIIRNEELILLRAEANIDNPAVAVEAINTIRKAHGLDDYSGGTDNSSLINEILKQKRYSLFGEGHRWIDMRRYDKISELPLDRPGDEIFVQFPRPVLEKG